MVLVDSSVWIESARKEGALDVKIALEELLDAYEATICPPVWLEVLGGAGKVYRRRLEAYFENLPFLPLPPETWRQAVKLSWKLRDAGTPVPWNDLLIAAIALAGNCRVYAVDGHFDTIEREIGLNLYRPGYGGRYNAGD